MKLILVFTLALLFAQQSKKSEVVRSGQEFEIKIEQEAVIEGEDLAIKFDSVLEDSRCPEGAACVWSGNAKVRLKLSKQKKTPETLDLNTNMGQKSSSYSNYEIKLVSLKPHPKTDTTLQQNEYKATLVVTKK